ncbi:MAG: S9 family peptidase [Longimicrobiales bacterium]
MKRTLCPLLPAVVMSAALTLWPTALDAQRLTVEDIFLSAEWRPQTLDLAGWLDARTFTFLAPDPQTGVADLWAEDAVTAERRRLVAGVTLVAAGAREPIEMEQVQWSADRTKLLIFTNSQRVWRRNTKGTYYVYDLNRQELTPVSTRAGWQMFAKLSPSGEQVGFVRENDLFLTDLRTGEERRLTDDGSETIINGTFDWVYEEELDLRDGWRWSPDGARIAFWQLDQSPVQTFYLIDEQPLYPQLLPLRYPKAGTANSHARIGVIELASGMTRWLDTGPDSTAYLARMDWAASADELVIQRLNRRQDRIDVLLADVASRSSRRILSESDEAWVDVDDDLTWLDGGRHFIWSSERAGRNHLYLYARDGSLVRQLTQGDWDVTAFYGVDEDGRWLYYQSAQPAPTQRRLERVSLEGGQRVALRDEPGTHAARFGPSFQYAVTEHSRFGVPPVTRVLRGDGTELRVLIDNAALRARLTGEQAPATEFFDFATPDGVTLNGWMLRPPAFSTSHDYPLLLYVYGGPGSQTVTDAWGGPRYLWHVMLAQRGYLVASVDNRGTGARGRDFKKQTYLRLGQLEAADQVSAARHLASLDYVDGDRVGIWGWSYGGYMTLLALMQGGPVFRAGIAGAPVTDWRFYDTIYTERFMRTPEENPTGYRDGAPLTYVEELVGDLLVIHGTADDNVHPQNTIQLVRALQDAGKQFDLMMYPNRTHAISSGQTGVHLYTLMTRWLDQQLMAAVGPSAAGR